MSSNALSLYAYTVTFSDPANAGNQHSVVMNSKGCNLDGCQPRYDGVRKQHTVTDHQITVASGSISGTSVATSNGLTAAGGDGTRARWVGLAAGGLAKSEEARP